MQKEANMTMWCDLTLDATAAHSYTCSTVEDKYNFFDSAHHKHVNKSQARESSQSRIAI